MIGFTTHEAANLLGGTAVGADVSFTRVNSDSRKSVSNSLFVAIPGENFDGHDYVEQALNGNAVAALVNRKLDVDIPQVIVANIDREAIPPYYNPMYPPKK